MNVPNSIENIFTTNRTSQVGNNVVVTRVTYYLRIGRIFNCASNYIEIGRYHPAVPSFRFMAPNGYNEMASGSFQLLICSP